MPTRPESARVAAPALPEPRAGATRAREPSRFTRLSWPVLVPLLTLVAALVHLPSFLRPVWNPDEGYLATQARMLASGGVLYDTVVDRKPPLLPWLYEGAFALFGDDSLWPLRAAAVAAHVVTAALLVALGRRRWGDRWGAAAGFGYLLLSVGLAPEDTQAASFEVFTLPWTAAAVLCADRGRWGAAGVAVAGAALTKQTGAMALVPVVWMLWQARRGSRAPTAGAWARLSAGCALPVTAVALATGVERFVFWTVTGSGAYMSPEGAWLLGAGRGLGNAAILTAAGAGLVLPAVRLAARRRPFAGTELWIWLGAAAVAVVAGYQFYGHYYLQLLPPLTLVGVAALRRLPGRGPARRAAAVWTVLAASVFTGWGLAAPRTELDHAHAVAAAIRAHTGEDETVLVWGMHPEQYWLAGRAPAGRFLTAGFLTNFSGGRGGARVGETYAVPGAWAAFRREFSAAPPAVVVDDSRGAPYGPAHIPGLRRLLAEGGYERVAAVDGAVFYARPPDR
ncbi:glycosyltransferase family 39 protein [Streptomyces sp. NPDC026673]|uniref:ArnT family glycosyltransferase n=1 Tax=Streptomyces sp. NPDC026673 TaxID=3155724 RepID=UPI00340C5898